MLIKYLTFIITILFFSPSFAGEELTIPRKDGHQSTIMLYGQWPSNKCDKVLLVSHGLGGSEKGLSYIGEAFSEKGYHVVVMGHTVLNERKDLRALIFSADRTKIIVDNEKFLHRFLDIEATLKFIKNACAPKNIFFAGHSLGAATTIIEAGAIANVKQRGSNRFDGYMALSHQGVGDLFEKEAWKNINKPVLMITGTKDKTANGSDYTSRLSAYENLPNINKRMAVIKDATHMNLGGRRNSFVRESVISLMEEFMNQILAQEFEASKSASEAIQIFESYN